MKCEEGDAAGAFAAVSVSGFEVVIALLCAL